MEDDQDDSLVVSEEDVTPNKMDLEPGNRISPETHTDNAERHERELEKPLCFEEPTSDETRTKEDIERSLVDNPRCSQPLRSVTTVLDSPAPST
ncbi:hypothetical protein AALP_AAs51508U000100, partial [Arabis alpina]